MIVQTGDNIGGYIIEQFFGEGGFGEVGYGESLPDRELVSRVGLQPYLTYK